VGLHRLAASRCPVDGDGDGGADVGLRGRRFASRTEKRAKGLEPSTSSLGSSVPVVLSAANKALTASRADRCTSRCTEKPGRHDELAHLVALVARLPGTDDERAGLLARAIELLGK
jgi:hypothetical protein